MPEVISDSIAEKLETAGLWRRAAARWLVVMESLLFTDEQREWVRQRRQYCLAQVAPVVAPEKLDITKIAKAASQTLESMGIASTKGEILRKYREINK